MRGDGGRRGSEPSSDSGRSWIEATESLAARHDAGRARAVARMVRCVRRRPSGYRKRATGAKKAQAGRRPNGSQRILFGEPAPCTLRQVGSLSRSRASDPPGNAPTVYGLEEPRRQRRSHRALLASPRALVADGTTDHEALAALAADQGSPPDPFGEAHPAARRACLQANAAALLRDAFGQPEESGSLAGRPQEAQGHFGTMRWKLRARPEEPASVRAPRTRPPGFRAGKG